MREARLRLETLNRALEQAEMKPVRQKAKRARMEEMGVMVREEKKEAVVETVVSFNTDIMDFGSEEL